MLQSKTTTCEIFLYFFLKLIVVKLLFYFSELRYNYGSNGCTVDLLSENKENNNRIKFKTGVRGDAKGGLNKCLDESFSFEGSYNNM